MPTPYASVPTVPMINSRIFLCSMQKRTPTSSISNFSLLPQKSVKGVAQVNITRFGWYKGKVKRSHALLVPVSASWKELVCATNLKGAGQPRNSLSFP